MGNLFEITQYLNDLSNEQLINLGGALGLHFPTLQRMSDLPNDMVAAWLLRQEDVLKTSGEPTYERLAVSKALGEIGQNGQGLKQLVLSKLTMQVQQNYYLSELQLEHL